MKIKTSELTGPAFHWAVAKCEGKVEQGVYGTPQLRDTELHLHYCDAFLDNIFSPTTNWEQGGPIIEREGINLTKFKKDEVDDCDVGMWDAAYDRDDFGNDAKSSIGPTPLIAAMRCYVASKLGYEVEIPKELS